MEELKNIITIVDNEYVKIIPQMNCFLKNKNIGDIFKAKSPTFATAGWEGRIYLFSNSLEHMSTLHGHERGINSLCAISNRILASGSYDKNIKIWNIEKRSIISTLSGHTDAVNVLCHLGEEQLASGSEDKSLIIWSKLPGSSTYSLSHVLTGHTSGIKGIIAINKTEIFSGEDIGDLMIWKIVQGVCIRQLPTILNNIWQMKQHHDVEVAFSYKWDVIIWGATNNWTLPFRLFIFCAGYSIEFLSDHLLLRGEKGQLEFVDYAQTASPLPPPIVQLHSNSIIAIQKIAKNIAITTSDDGSLKVIDPIFRNCYLNFKEGYHWMKAIAYFY